MRYNLYALSAKSNTMKKILIASAYTGSGHNSIANILAETIKSLGKNTYEVKIYHVLGKKTSIPYRILGPTSLMDNTYNKTNNLIGRNIILDITGRVLNREIKKVINDFKPDIVLAVHYFYFPALNRLKIPYYIFVTDPFSVHAIWAETEAEKVVVFSREARKRLLSLLVPKNKIVLSKFPLRNQFSKPASKEAIRKKLHLKNSDFVILLGGSGEGMDRAKQIAKSLHKSSLNFKCVVICGRNSLLRLQLLPILLSDDRFIIHGYVQNISTYLRTCDIFVGKAGANILFECISQDIPIVAIPPVLPQEVGNRKFITKNNIGYVFNNTDDAFHKIGGLINNKQELKTIIRNIHAIKHSLTCSSREFSTIIDKIIK